MQKKIDESDFLLRSYLYLYRNFTADEKNGESVDNIR